MDNGVAAVGGDPYVRHTSDDVTLDLAAELTRAVSGNLEGLAVNLDGARQPVEFHEAPEGFTFVAPVRRGVLAVTYRRHVPSRTFTGLVRTFRREGFPVVVESLGRPGWRRLWIITPTGGDQTQRDELRAVVCALLEDDDAAAWHEAGEHLPPPLVRPVKGWAGLVSPTTVPEALEMLGSPPPDVAALGRAVGALVPSLALARLRTVGRGADATYSAVTSLLNAGGWSDEAIIGLVLAMPVAEHAHRLHREGGKSPERWLAETVIPRQRQWVALNPKLDPAAALEQIDRHHATASSVWHTWPRAIRETLKAHHRLAREQRGGTFSVGTRDVAPSVTCSPSTVSRDYWPWLIDRGWLRVVKKGAGSKRTRWRLAFPGGDSFAPGQSEGAPEGGATVSHQGKPPGFRLVEGQPSIDEPESTDRRTALEGVRRPSGYDGRHPAYLRGALGDGAGDTLAYVSETEPRNAPQLRALMPDPKPNVRTIQRHCKLLALPAGRADLTLIERTDGGWVKVEGWADLLDPIAEAYETADAREHVRRQVEAERSANLDRRVRAALTDSEWPLYPDEIGVKLDVPASRVSRVLKRLHEDYEAVRPHDDGTWSPVSNPTTTTLFIDGADGEVLAELTDDSTPGQAYVPPRERNARARFVDELAEGVLADMQDGQPDS